MLHSAQRLRVCSPVEVHSALPDVMQTLDGRREMACYVLRLGHCRDREKTENVSLILSPPQPAAACIASNRTQDNAHTRGFWLASRMRLKHRFCRAGVGHTEGGGERAGGLGVVSRGVCGAIL